MYVCETESVSLQLACVNNKEGVGRDYGWTMDVIEMCLWGKKSVSLNLRR